MYVCRRIVIVVVFVVYSHDDFGVMRDVDTFFICIAASLLSDFSFALATERSCSLPQCFLP